MAAEFLVPTDDLRGVWPKIRLHPKPFEPIARHFKVSKLVAARRALDLGLVSRADFLEFYNEYLAQHHRKPDDSTGGDYYAAQALRLSARFVKAVIAAVHEERLLYREAYQLTGMRGRTFAKFAAKIGGEAMP